MNKEEFAVGDNSYFECKIIKDICPYECDCDECPVTKAIEEARKISRMKQDGIYDKEMYDEYHADDYKRQIEDEMLEGRE